MKFKYASIALAACSVVSPSYAVLTDVAKGPIDEGVALAQLVVPAILLFFIIMGIVRLNRGFAPLGIAIAMTAIYVGIPLIFEAMGLTSPYSI